MINRKNMPILLLIIFALVINLFGALYYYNHVTGQIEEARLLYESIYGDDSDFNSIFWLCQKIFTMSH